MLPSWQTIGCSTSSKPGPGNTHQRRRAPWGYCIKHAVSKLIHGSGASNKTSSQTKVVFQLMRVVQYCGVDDHLRVHGAAPCN